MCKMGRTVAAGLRRSSGARRADSLKHLAYLGVQTPIPAQRQTGSKTHFRRCKHHARGTQATHARHRLSDFGVLPPRCELHSAESHCQKSLARVQSMQGDVPLCCEVAVTIKPHNRTRPVYRERRGRIATGLFESPPFSGVALSGKRGEVTGNKNPCPGLQKHPKARP